MNLTHGKKSIILLAVSIVALLLLSYFESAFSGLSTSIERIVSFILLVLPEIAGVVFGILGLVKKEPQKWIAILGVILNGLFAMFMLFVLSFAG